MKCGECNGRGFQAGFHDRRYKRRCIGCGGSGLEEPTYQSHTNKNVSEDESGSRLGKSKHAYKLGRFTTRVG